LTHPAKLEILGLFAHGSLYELMAKVLAGRLAKVMDKLISHNRSAFIRGGQLVMGGGSQ
jgi:hypothetical protein